MYNNRVEIELQSVLGNKILREDPIGYDQSETEIGRSEKTFGIFLKVVNNLEFVGESKEYLENLYQLHGIQAKCRLIRKQMHPTTDEWFIHSRGYLDFSTYKVKDGKLQIAFIEGELREVLTSQIREKFELNRITDINDNLISELRTDRLNLKGRNIFLRSEHSSGTTTQFELNSGEWNSGDDFRYAFAAFPMEVTANSDTGNVSNVFDNIGSDNESPSVNEMFYFIADRDRGQTKLNINVNFTILTGEIDQASDLNLKVVLRKYTGGDSYIFDRADDMVLLDMGDPTTAGNLQTPKSVSLIDYIHEPKQGESYALGLALRGKYGGGLSKGSLILDIGDYSGSINREEDSFFGQTLNPCLPAYDVFKRLSEIYTGKENFESSLLDGTDTTLLSDDNHNLVFAPGGWIRNLKRKEEDGNEVAWPMEISFEDAYKSINAIMPVGYGIEIKGNRQNIILEDLKFFFQRVITMNIGKIKINERSIATEYCYQSMKFGYIKGGEYEKPLGLDEYNTQTTFKTPLTVVDNEYEVLSPSRADAYGAEDARRKQYEDFPDEDTTYDKDNFLFDVKHITTRGVIDYFEPREPLEDFEELPTGVYSPETAYNLNLSPARNRNRHAWWFKNAVVKLNEKKIQFLNAKGNSQLQTKKIGEDYLKENSDVVIGDLPKPLFEPEWIDAEISFNQDIYEQLLGTTKINGRDINNYYGLVEFINEENRTEYGYLFTAKVKDKITFKLLKAYGIQ